MKKNYIYTMVAVLLSVLYSCDTKIPTANFTISNTTVKTGNSVSFTNNSDAYFYHWDFGDETQSTEHSPELHTYEEEGSYTITLTAFSKNGKLTAIHSEGVEVIKNEDEDNIEITSPTSSSSWKTNNSYNITWNSSDNGSVKIELYRSGSFIETITSSTSNDGSYSYSVSSELSNSDYYKVKITKTDNSAIYDESDNFTIEDEDNIEITSPTSSSSWETNNSYNITWNSSDNGSVKIELYRSGSFIETITSSTSNDGSYSYSVSSELSNSDYYKVKITKTDNSAIYDESDNFTITTAASTNQIEDFETGSWSTSLFVWQYYTAGKMWYFQENQVYEGSYAIWSDYNISDGEYASTFVTNTYNAGTISFYSKVSSESGYDFLKFYIDNELKESWSGETEWELHTYNVSAGEHTFLWKYEKDGSNSVGYDRGYVDYITFPTTSNNNNNNNKIGTSYYKY